MAAAARQMDPRVKLFSTLVFMTVILSTPISNYWKFAVYSAILAGLIAMARIPLKLLLRRLFLLLPLLVFLALSLLLFRDEPAARKWDVILNLYIKTVLIFFCLALLSMTGDFYALVKGLERMKVPAALVSILAFAYRYLFLFQQEAGRIRWALASRSVGRRRRIRETGRLFHLVPHFLSRVLDRSEKIYAAMLSRGFAGKLPTIDSAGIHRGDYIFASILSLLLMAVRVA